MVTYCQYSSPLIEIDYANQPTEGILVVMDSFKLPDYFWPRLRFFDRSELLFVNKSDAAKLKGFTLYDDEFQIRLTDQLAEVPTLSQSNALKDSCLRGLIMMMVLSPTLFDHIPSSKPLAKLRTLVETYVIDDNAKLSPHVDDTLPKGVDPDALYVSIKEKHWQFMTFFTHYNDYHVGSQTPEFKLIKELTR